MRAAILHYLCASAFIGGLLVLAGCGSAVSHGRSTALGGLDLVQMTDDMAMKIVADPEVRSAVGRGGPLKIVVMPVENRMRAEVLPRGQAEAFTGRVRTLLARHAKRDFTWIMNRETFYRLRDRELADVDPGPSPEKVQPDYALSAVFTSLADEDAKRRSSYYVCRYALTNISNSTVLWTESYEVKKVAVKGFLD